MADQEIRTDPAGGINEENTGVSIGPVGRWKAGRQKRAELECDSAYYYKKMLSQSRLRTFFCGVIALVIAALGIFAISAASQVNRILYNAESTFDNLNEIAADFQEVDLQGMLSEVNVLIEDGQSAAADASAGMAKAVEKIETLDIEKLNQSIEDFSAIVEPLSRFFGR